MRSTRTSHPCPWQSAELNFAVRRSETGSVCGRSVSTPLPIELSSAEHFDAPMSPDDRRSRTARCCRSRHVRDDVEGEPVRRDTRGHPHSDGGNLPFSVQPRSIRLRPTPRSRAPQRRSASLDAAHVAHHARSRSSSSGTHDGIPNQLARSVVGDVAARSTSWIVAPMAPSASRRPSGSIRPRSCRPCRCGVLEQQHIVVARAPAGLAFPDRTSADPMPRRTRPPEPPDAERRIRGAGVTKALAPSPTISRFFLIRSRNSTAVEPSKTGDPSSDRGSRCGGWRSHPTRPAVTTTGSLRHGVGRQDRRRSARE